MTRVYKVTLLLSLLALAASSLFAQTSSTDADLRGKTIERFDVAGNTSVAKDTIRVYLGVNPGEPYNPEALRSNFLNLWQTGLFDDVRIDASKGESGVIIKATVRERPRIGAVEYKGNKSLTTAKIGEALEHEKIDLHVGNTIEQTLIKRAAETIRKTYTEGGYEGVTVETRLEDRPNPAEKKIVFIINEGIKAKVAAIDFAGNKRFSDRRLRSVMKDVKTDNLITWIRKKNLYVPSKLQEDLEKVRNYYQDYGYKDVQFGDPQIITLKKRKPRVKIVIPVTEGPVHTYRDVSVSGNKVFTSEQMIGKWPLKKGDILSRKPIQARIDGFEDAYRRLGYIYAYVNPEYVEAENNVVDVHLEVFEGDQFTLGRLEFEGNTVTKDKVLRREIYLDEGSVMDMETFKASLYKLGQLGYFKVTQNPDFKVNPQNKTVDVTVKGEEEGKNDVQFGGGYSETYGFFGQFSFSTRNFLGEGETFGVNYQRGRRQNFFSLSYSDPWFMDRPHSLGVSIFDRQTILPASVGFESRSKGGSVAYGYHLSRFQNFSVSYGYQRSREHTEFTPTPDPDGNIPLPDIADNSFITSAVIPAWRYDSRDNPFDTTRGAKSSISLAYEGGPLGGTIDIIKPSLDYTIFKKLSKRSSVDFNVEVGTIIPTSSSNCANSFADLAKFKNKLCVPRSERFFVGGEYSVRGFRSYSIGPRETLNGQSVVVGGYSYNVFNLEYILRVNEPLRFVLFADAGQSYGYKARWDFSALRYSTGAELRIFLPVFQFPLRFIYAINPDSRKGDEFESFQFTIGNTF
ncbi:MAG TPA: outer membrane protein assembly factor BamA [Thermoanaerobaculia bacterium]|nr:outer membrane protein assembly factor BamA [Thermoanaerobaculia bacterium]